MLDQTITRSEKRDARRDQVAELVRRGHTTPEISVILGVPAATIKNDRYELGIPLVKTLAARHERRVLESRIRKAWGHGWTDSAIARHVDCDPGTVRRARRRLGLAQHTQTSEYQHLLAEYRFLVSGGVSHELAVARLGVSVQVAREFAV